jgi:hypothetical protein
MNMTDKAMTSASMSPRSGDDPLRFTRGKAKSAKAAGSQ